jgi:hypothetical protein
MLSVMREVVSKWSVAEGDKGDRVGLRVGRTYSSYDTRGKA